MAGAEPVVGGTTVMTETGVAALRRALRTLREGHRVLLTASDEDELMGRMCSTIVEAGGYELAWVGLAVDDAARSVRVLAQAGRPDYVHEGMVSWAAGHELGDGPTGRAIRTGTVQVNGHVATTEGYEPWRERALAAGFSSSIAVPVDWPNGGRACLSIYAAEPHAFDGDAISLLGDLAADLAFGVARLRDLDALRAEAEHRARLEREVMNARRLDSIGRLAGAVAHDFNNLLTVVQGSAELALSELDASDDFDRTVVRADLRAVLDAASRGRTLTQRLLMLGRRNDAGAGPIVVIDAVRSLADLLDRMVGSTVTVDYELDPACPSTWMELGALEQVLVNLVANAADAIASGPRDDGRVRIRVGVHEHVAGAVPSRLPPGTFVRIDVDDDGGGMDAEVAAHAFEPFFTTKGPELGTGLGLATVHDVALAAGGLATIASTPGAGTTVSVFLPAMR